MEERIDTPTVIVGMGGSGTRAVTYAVRACGVYLGTNTNGVKEDALAFAEFDYRWTPPWLVAAGDCLEEQMRDEHRACVADHLRDLPDPDRPWGWKHCPSGHLVPFLARCYAGLRVIHVLRDGRDMAFGDRGGRTHTLRLGRAVLDDDPEPVVPGSDAWRGRAPAADGTPCASPMRQAAFWAALNGSIADWGSGVGEDAYLRVRLEDLASDPARHVPRLSALAGAPPPDRATAAHLERHLSMPPSVGRWRSHDRAETASISEVLGDALERFGYA